ncbi:MAG: hypothetical protein WCK11_05860 [Candidatus Falkowbacteria bacterium]
MNKLTLKIMALLITSFFVSQASLAATPNNQVNIKMENIINEPLINSILKDTGYELSNLYGTVAKFEKCTENGDGKSGDCEYYFEKKENCTEQNINNGYCPSGKISVIKITFRIHKTISQEIALANLKTLLSDTNNTNITDIKINNYNLVKKFKSFGADAIYAQTNNWWFEVYTQNSASDLAIMTNLLENIGSKILNQKTTDTVKNASEEAKIIVLSGKDLNIILKHNKINKNTKGQSSALKKYTNVLIKKAVEDQNIKAKKPTTQQTYSMNNYIFYGTKSTSKISTKKRAQSIELFIMQKKKLPATGLDWDIVIQNAKNIK